MNVSFNPAINRYNTSFSSLKKKDEANKAPLTEEKKMQEIYSTRLKTVAKICFAVSIGMDILYFASKRTFKNNSINSMVNKRNQLKAMAAPKKAPPPLVYYNLL